MSSEPSKDEAHLSNSVFTTDETTDLVKGFIVAWMRGQVKFDLPTPKELKDDPTNGHLNDAQSIGLARRLYREMENSAEIILGTTPSTTAERAEAMHYFAGLILRLRSINRVQGVFDTMDTQQKLEELTQKVDAIGRVIHEFVKWLRGL